MLLFVHFYVRFKTSLDLVLYLFVCFRLILSLLYCISILTLKHPQTEYLPACINTSLFLNSQKKLHSSLNKQANNMFLH